MEDMQEYEIPGPLLQAIWFLTGVIAVSIFLAQGQTCFQSVLDSARVVLCHDSVCDLHGFMDHRIASLLFADDAVPLA